MVVVAAGMEGALPSVVGGLVEAPVIAVPTSIGYGASFQGLAALLAMLNSCASGSRVVNIDNGFGAGYMAAPRSCQVAGLSRRNLDKTVEPSDLVVKPLTGRSLSSRVCLARSLQASTEPTPALLSG